MQKQYQIFYIDIFCHIASDDSNVHYCDEYKAIFTRSLVNIRSLKDIRQKNLGKIVIFHVNINSVRQKSDSLIEITTGNIDILMMLKLDIDC